MIDLLYLPINYTAKNHIGDEKGNTLCGRVDPSIATAHFSIKHQLAFAAYPSGTMMDEYLCGNCARSYNARNQKAKKKSKGDKSPLED